jgi:predicted nucleic acid-binding protein
VADASPLIALDSIGRLDLLGQLGHDVAVPPAVLREVSYHGRTVLPPTVAILDSVELVPTVAMWGLGAGETEVLSYSSRSTNAEAILDDLAARRCAAAHGIPTRGTIGVIVVAKRLGVISAAKPIFESLRQGGFHVASGVLEAALKAAGEQ